MLLILPFVVVLLVVAFMSSVLLGILATVVVYLLTGLFLACVGRYDQPPSEEKFLVEVFTWLIIWIKEVRSES